MNDVPLPLDEPIVIHEREIAKLKREMTPATAIVALVDEIEDAMTRKQVADEDIKMLVDNARGQGFSKYDIAAMKQAANMRLKDKTVEAKKKMEALQRVADAVGMDLFSFAGVRG